MSTNRLAGKSTDLAVQPRRGKFQVFLSFSKAAHNGEIVSEFSELR
jgi:hypothetical protein